MRGMLRFYESDTANPETQTRNNNKKEARHLPRLFFGFSSKALAYFTRTALKNLAPTVSGAQGPASVVAP